jgi:hypothetical protein
LLPTIRSSRVPCESGNCTVPAGPPLEAMLVLLMSAFAPTATRPVTALAR